jgi:hypothetical protein
MNNTKLNESMEKLETMKSYQQQYLQDSEKEFQKVVGSLSVEKVDNMTDEEILKFNNYEEGKYYVEQPEFESKEELVDYVRSVIRFLVQTYEFTLEMEGKVKELDGLTKETNQLIRKSFGLDENVSSIEVIEKAIEDGLNQALDLNDKEKYESILQSKNTFKETFTLDRLKKLYLTIGSTNLKEDAKSSRSLDIYQQYLKVQQKLGSQYDLIQVSDLEVRFLPEEYHEMNNLFIIACIKYISKCMKNGYYSSDTAFFVSQLTTNLFMLHLNKLPEKYKETLLTNIKEFLDILR